MRTLSHRKPSASTALLRRLLLFRLRPRRGSRRWRRGALLFVPLVELLLLLLLVLRVALLYWRSGPYQGMRLLRNWPWFLLLRRPQVPVRRLRITVFVRLRIPVLGPALGRR